MASPEVLSNIKVIDTDSHISEPPDLWTSRAPAKFKDLVPSVKPFDKTGKDHWTIGGNWFTSTGQFSYAGSEVFPPMSFLKNLEEGEAGAWDPVARIKRLDEFGLHAQVLYPNIIAFEPMAFIKLGPELALLCNQIYNDFLADFASVDPTRLVPIAAIPFWDVEESVKEIKRAKELGHKGILFANKLEKINFPVFTDEHWDPIYAVCQDLEMSVNFHTGFGGTDEGLLGAENIDTWAGAWVPKEAARANAVGMMSNGDCIAQICVSGIAERFPTLPFVSVESGMGYLPYLIESLDWHYKGYGADKALGAGPLPSEIFRRQCYGSFWFERGTLVQLEQYPDNFMFETDYPHPTSLSPGPASPADLVTDHIQMAFANVPDDVARKALHDNAARLYHLD